MSIIKKMATAGAVAVMGLGLGAASASAYDIQGGDYTGTGTSQHTFTVNNAYMIACDAQFVGNTDNVSGQPESTDFRPGFSNCDFFGFEASVTTNEDWRLTVTSDNGLGRYFGDITIPAGSPDPAVVIKVPLIGCEVYVDGHQQFNHGDGTPPTQNELFGDNGSPFELNGHVYGITYTTNGLCPFGNGSDGEYNTNGPVSIPGVSVV